VVYVVDTQGGIDILAAGSTPMDWLQRRPDIRTSSDGRMVLPSDDQ